MDADARTHKNKNAISIFLPALDHFVIFIVCGLGVYGEERPGAVTEVGFSLGRLIRCWAWGLSVKVMIYHVEVKMVRMGSRGR
jgi:hypothetical protein